MKLFVDVFFEVDKIVVRRPPLLGCYGIGWSLHTCSKVVDVVV